MSEKLKLGDKTAAGVRAGKGEAEEYGAPGFQGTFRCMRQGPNGPYVAWQDDWKNVVVNQGKAFLLNRFFGTRSNSATNGGWFLALHSATTASNHSWADISASQVHSYGANTPLITFASDGTGVSTSVSATYGFSASTQTVSGAAVLWYTTNTMSTSVAGGNLTEYSEGQFAAGSRLVSSGDTLQVTLSVQLT